MELRSTEYRMIHFWVEKKLGIPHQCSKCHTKERNRYHWANISGKYMKKISDWRRLCVSCHKLGKYFDYCKRGHKRNENKYIRPDGRTECRECGRENSRRWWIKQEYIR